MILHGGPGAHHDYLLPQYDLLAQGRELLYYDQRGGGRSPVPRETPLGWREHVADLETSTTARFEASAKTGKARRFKEFVDGAASWSRVERIIARVEVGAQGADTRFMA